MPFDGSKFDLDLFDTFGVGSTPQQPILFPGIVPDYPGVVPGVPGVVPGYPGPIGGFGFVLDGLTTAPSIAYSFRLLSANYNGAAINVRRSSDNTAIDIGFAQGGGLDTQALLAFCGSGSGYVTVWYNQGTLGSSGNATQSTASSQPQIVAAGVLLTQGGKPTLAIGGTQGLGTSYNFAAGTYSSTMTAVYSATTNSTTEMLAYFPYISGTTQGQTRGFLLNNGSNPSVDAWSNNIECLYGVTTLANLQISSGVWSGSGATVKNYYNGTLGTTNPSAGFNTVSGPLGIGTSYGGSLQFTGNLSEFLITLVDSPTDRTTYDLNAAAFYSISGVTQ
jgi:hypothetical protein